MGKIKYTYYTAYINDDELVQTLKEHSDITIAGYIPDSSSSVIDFLLVIIISSAASVAIIIAVIARSIIVIIIVVIITRSIPIRSSLRSVRHSVVTSVTAVIAITAIIMATEAAEEIIITRRSQRTGIQ